MEKYYRQIKEISASTGIPEPQDWYSTLLGLPDVLLKTDVEQLNEEEWEVADGAIDQAIEELLKFRHQEGAALEKKFHGMVGRHPYKRLSCKVQYPFSRLRRAKATYTEELSGL